MRNIDPTDMNTGANYFITHSRTSGSSSLAQNITMVVSMPTAPLLFDAPGSLTVPLTAFRHKLAYLKLNVPASRISNGSLTVSFTGTPGDLIIVTSSASRWPVGRVSATTTQVDSGVPTTIPITACDIDFTLGLVYLSIVYRPVTWTSGVLQAGTSQVTVDFSYRSMTSRYSLPANVTAFVPAGTKRVYAVIFSVLCA